MENWSDLSSGILELIMNKFSAIEDFVRFGAVCRSWRSVSVDQNRKLSNNSMMEPWLMLAEKEEDSDKRGFYSLSTQKVYHLNLPEARDRRCWSSQGWLITMGLDLEIHLLNPFSQAQIRLPIAHHEFHRCSESVRQQLRQNFILKVVLSSRPSLLQEEEEEEDDDDEKCVIMAIYSPFRKLAFLRLRDEVWRDIDDLAYLYDVIYFNGQFYVIDFSGRLYTCDISSRQPKITVFAEPTEGVFVFPGGDQDFYLVESAGELFMVLRHICQSIYTRKYESDEVADDKLAEGSTSVLQFETEGFSVYKFNFENRKWMEVESLDNRALFVGNNSSFAIFPSNHHHPGCGCQPNSIYFTDSFQDNLFYGAGNDIGVFRMETQEIESHYVGPDCFSDFCTPLWIFPSL